MENKGAGSNTKDGVLQQRAVVGGMGSGLYSWRLYLGDTNAHLWPVGGSLSDCLLPCESQ